MATIGQLPNPPRPAVISSGRPRIDFAYVKNGIIRAVNDSINPEKKADNFPYYAAKVQGAKKVKEFTDVSGSAKGGFIYVHPDPDVKNRDHILMAFGNLIKVKIGDDYATVRDVTNDGLKIAFMSVDQGKRYAYITIGDPSMSTKLYRYDGITNHIRTITSVANNGSGLARVTVGAGHNLYNGDYVNISGTTNYNGKTTATVIDGTRFDIHLPFTSNQSGSLVSHPKTGAPVTITALNPSKNVFLMEGRLGSVPIGTSSTLPQFSAISTAGLFTNFTAGAAVADGGEFSGSVGSVNFGLTHRSLYFLFSDDRVTIHAIKPPIYVGGSTSADLVKDTDTIREGFTLDGLGCPSPKAATTGFGSLFFVDPKKGVYQYDVITQRLKNLSEPFVPILDMFDLSNASIMIHPGEELLIVTVATSADIGQNAHLIYSFQSKRWSIDFTKSTNQLLWNPVDKKLYGLGSIEPSLFQIYDGTFSTSTGAPIEIEINTSFFDGGRMSRYKEYLDSSVEIGFETGVESFTYEILVDNNEAPQTSETIDLSGFSKQVEIEPHGSFGESVVAEGFFERDRSLLFKRHFNDDPIDDFKKASIRIREKSSLNFVVGSPEMVILPTEDELAETS